MLYRYTQSHGQGLEIQEEEIIRIRSVSASQTETGISHVYLRPGMLLRPCQADQNCYDGSTNPPQACHLRTFAQTYKAACDDESTFAVNEVFECCGMQLF